MRSVSQALRDHLAANNAFFVADLLTLTIGATSYRWTTADQNISFQGNTFTAAGPVIKLGRSRLTSTLQVDTTDITLQTGGDVLIGTKPLALAAADGAFDGATVQVDRVYMPTWGDTSLGAKRMFKGVVSSVEPSSTSVRVTVKSEVEKLNGQVPLYRIQTACPLSLYSPGCGVSRAAHTVATTAAAGSTRSVVNVAASIPAWSADTSSAGINPTWAVRVTSGANAGQRRQVVGANSGTKAVSLDVPLPYTPAIGDTVELVRGCDKTLKTCLDRFNNLARFRGFAHAPPENA